VFIVHGHDNAARESVARFIEKLKLNAIILLEQPSRGRTIIQKFRDHAELAGFAVVLLTPDDVVMAKGASGLQDRARQNVIFELGFFLGLLGDGHVCALNAGVEIPSDFAGVIYEKLDPAGAWKLALAKEMKAAGLDVDMNLAM
jgi:predicted nucleotide-binding protein